MATLWSGKREGGVPLTATIQVDDVPAPPAAVDGEVGGDAKEP